MTGYGSPAQAEATLRFLEAAKGIALLQDRIQRLRRVAKAAEDYGLSNDIGDDLYDALDALQPGDLEDGE